VIDPIHLYEEGMDDIVPDEFEMRVAEEMTDVVLVPRKKIVDTDHVFSAVHVKFT
jgi:hypothetical protein